MSGSRSSAHSKANIALINGTIWTVDRRLPLAQAVAVGGNKILAVGQEKEIHEWVGPDTQVIDLEGRLVLPGFNDCHTHFLATAARGAVSFNLLGADSLQEVQRRLVQMGKDHPELDWLMGIRWAPPHHRGEWPTKEDLDAVESIRPVAIFDQDGHTAWVNSAALWEIGYNEDTPDPEGGAILRDDKCHPPGILFDKAHEPISREPSLPYDCFSEAVTREVGEISRVGLTSISDNSNPERHLSYLDRMATEGVLNLRVNHWPDAEDGLDSALKLRSNYQDNDQIQAVGLKVFFDGVLSNRSAWLLEAYADAPCENGYAVIDRDDFSALVQGADAEGLQVITHAIGDRAVREVLDACQRAERRNGQRDSRHRIEHLELVHPKDQVRFARMNVIPSMTPLHCSKKDPDTYLPARIGSAREGYAYPWRNLLDLGAHLCFGTDWPTITLPLPDPLQQIFMAVTRTSPEDPDLGAWHPEQALTVEHAIRCCTLEPAYAEFQEQQKGSISAGKLADLCVLERNILREDPRQILDTEVVMTIFDGRIVYAGM